MVVAISEGNGIARGEVGIACLDIVEHPGVQIFQFSDSSSYMRTCTKLLHLQPVEIISELLYFLA